MNKSVTNKKNYLYKLIYTNDMQKHLLSYHSHKFVNTVQILKVARYHITHPNSKKISTKKSQLSIQSDVTDSQIDPKL